MATHSFVESGRKGGFRKWAKKTPKERSDEMRRIALLRWKKKDEI